MENLFKLLLLVLFISFSGQSYGQEDYGSDVPGADLYEGKCRVDYVNAYRDGKACADGNETFCGINQPTNSPECRTAQMEGYVTGYESGGQTGYPDGFEYPGLGKWHGNDGWSIHHGVYTPN